MTHTFAHSGDWFLAVVMIVLASWIYYHYFAPSNWREWAVSGLVQAFFISLYAEMYGFPLTIYLLVRFFGLDSHYLSANLWSTLLGMGETGMLVAMLLGYALVMTGLGILAEGWREVYRARQQGVLATRGLYAMVRHPQYTGLLLGLFGEGVVHWPTLFSVTLFPIICVAYVLLARKEEAHMFALFGEEYRRYHNRVPMFIPHWGTWQTFANTRE